ncbi:MAG: chemotaxis protein CheW [Myxococcales bacterium]|nr:chemotaxis protein CheW [Myxococcales bacterium]
MEHMCIFRVGELHMCLPIEQVQQVFETDRIHRVPLSPRAIRGLVNLRGLVVSALDMRIVLDLNVEGPPSVNNLVAVHEGHTVSLLVDEVLGVTEVAPASILPTPTNLPPTLQRLARGVMCRDDALVLVVDAQRIMAIAA